MSDILWKFAPTGVVIETDMNDRTVLSSGGLDGDSNWSVAGTGDFNDDGKSDILWRYAPTGMVVETVMNDRSVLGSWMLGGDANWKPVPV